jgi:hemerythrin-like domain-containing protein
MPVIIGETPKSSFTDPIGLLGDCHRRIERFLEVLVRVAGEARGNPLTDEQRTALDSALRYFREAAPKHTADEEDSLFPRLRQSASPEAAAALEEVARLERDHRRADELHAEADRLGQAWLAADSLDPSGAARLAAVLAELSELYTRHIAVEEREVFPAAARALPEAECRAIGVEMAARRLPTVSPR